MDFEHEGVGCRYVRCYSRLLLLLDRKWLVAEGVDNANPDII